MAWAEKKFPALGHMSTIQCKSWHFPLLPPSPKIRKKKKVNKSFLKLQSG